MPGVALLERNDRRRLTRVDRSHQMSFRNKRAPQPPDESRLLPTGDGRRARLSRESGALRPGPHATYAGLKAHATVADTAAGPAQRRAALVLCLAVAAVTIGLLPFASERGPVLPGFILINQTALVVAYGLSAWVLFSQFRRGRTWPLLLAASGALYTTAIVGLQLLSFPGIVASGRLLGSGPETTTWLWTFWHIGPPVWAVMYAVSLRRGRPRPLSPTMAPRAAVAGAVAALGIAGLAAFVATAGLVWLPHQVTGDDYTDLTRSGVGPMVQVLTVLALLAVWRATRGGRTVLELWIAASLLLLVFDNILTMAAGARGTNGWFVGRIEALVSAFVILWAYLHEVDALRAHAEKAADQVARTGDALRQAQKLEAVGRLTGGIAHDFNNLLMIITSGLEMIRRRPHEPERVIRMADAGIAAAERGAQLTRQLLTFSRRQHLRPETVNANASLIEFEPLARRAAGDGVTIEFHLDPALHPIRIDRGEFDSAVLNLIVNAREVLQTSGGRIRVSTRNAERVEQPDGPSLDGMAVGQYVVISVADDGPGMDEWTRAQAFEPFFTTKEFGKGSGLGLSQVYGFARASGGTAEIASTSESGTVVEIWLPRAATAQAPGGVPASQASVLRRADEGETVLAVDDEPALLATLVENLADLGYRVIPARNAAEALDQLRSDQRIDILFSDIVMPGGMNGVQLAVEASRLRSGLRVLLTSGYTDEALASEHNIPVDVPIITKPYRRSELSEQLRAARSAMALRHPAASAGHGD